MVVTDTHIIKGEIVMAAIHSYTMEKFVIMAVSDGKAMHI